MRTIGTVFLLVSLDLFVRQTCILISLEVVDYLVDRLREGVLHAAGDSGVRTAELRSSPRLSMHGGPAGQTRSSAALTDGRSTATRYDCDALGCGS